MRSLSLELAGTSNAIARTMAEAAAAGLLAAPALAPSASDAANPPSESAGDVNIEGDVKVLEGGAGRGGGGGRGGNGVGRSRAEAQKEVDRLKARQAELFDLIQLKREVKANFEFPQPLKKGFSFSASRAQFPCPVSHPMAANQLSWVGLGRIGEGQPCRR